MSLGFDFLMDFDPKMVPKKEPEQLLFLERLFYRFLKDVPNKTPTFEVSRDPKIETENHKKAWKFQLPQKLQKSIKNESKIDQKSIKNRSKND